MIEFKGKFDSNTTKTANNFAMKKLWWLYLLMSVLLILLGVSSIIEKALVGGILFICFGILFFPICFLFTKLLQKRIDNSTSILSIQTDEVYQFNEDKFFLAQKKNDDYQTTLEAKYSYFYKVIETATHYFLYLSKIQMHVIDKSTITEGSIEELNTLLSTQLKDKFHKYNAQ